MEDGPPTIGFEDGTIDVERLLVEPQDGHVSVDSVMCFNERIPEKAMDMEDFSRNFGVTNTGITREREDILNRDVLDSVSSEVEVGYFRLQNDFCSIGEDYLLGVEFSESITNLDYGSSEGLLTSVSDSSVLASSPSPWKADLFRIMDLPECQNHQLNIDASFSEVPSLCHGTETLADEKPPKSPISCNLQDIGKFHDISSCIFQDILSDGNDTVLSPPVEMFCKPKNEKNDEFGPTGQNGEPNRLETMSTRANCNGDLTMQKRSRKPTQRYIDELVDPISRYSKRRREVSYSTVKDKSVGVKDHKKCRVGSRAVALPAEESSVVAIQVPFGSLVHKECPTSPAYQLNKEVGTSYKQARSTDRGNLIIKSEDNRATTQNQKRRDECTTSVHQKKRDHNLTTASQKKSDHNVTATHVKKRDECLTTQSQKKKNDFDLSTSPKKTDDCLKTVHQKKKDDCPTEESSEEVSGRRKHHRLWTIAEIKKLIDGVSEYGVGRWSRIKKLLFSASAHRTSVDLKDKWRNLLKASRMQLGTQQGEKKRNLAWRPLPKSILRRVCELANMYPYPKGRKHKIAHIHHDSPDQSTDITLNDYRRILRSINGN